LSIERLEEIKDEFCEYKKEPDYDYDMIQISLFMLSTIDTFKNQQAQITDLKKRVKKLEQSQTYYPTEEYEGKIDIKIGGTD